MSTGNPYFMEGLKERRQELLNRLLNTERDEWSKVIARFAFDYNLRRVTVEKYFELLLEAGLLDG